MISDEDFASVCELVYEELVNSAPFDTGNLALNAITLNMPSSNKGAVYVNRQIAPYMPYTNEPWLSPWWRGAKNPNEAWWNTACENAIKNIADLLGGELKKL
nr:MAG TPA: hypothetical protein [Caudoviricetes sp.]